MTSPSTTTPRAPRRTPSSASTGAALPRIGAIAAVVATLVTIGFSMLGGSGPAAGATSGTTPPSYIAAADYFGTGDPLNDWSSDESGALQAFTTMKRDGFNAVGLVVPWGEFEPGLTPPRMNPTALAQLNRLISDAASLHMGVILRLSYEWDPDPADQLPTGQRFAALWSTQGVYTAWLDYIGALDADVSKFHNVWGHYLSWEDLWEPVFEASGATTAHQRLTLAVTTGYRSWLQSTLSLGAVDEDYGTTFTSWTDVPTPTYHRSSFRLMYEYQDWALVNRLFLPAQQRFPGLTLESRVDVDPIYTGTAVVGSYAHTAQFSLPGTPVTGIYFSPYQGDPSSTRTETAGQAVQAMQNTLSRVYAQSAGRKLFIYEYEYVSNAGAVADDPAIVKSELATFVAQSEPVLAQYTSGFALWTYHDYNTSFLYNPSFALGAQGWTLRGGGRLERTGAARYAALAPHALLSQKVGASAAAQTVSFQAKAPRATSIDVTLGAGPTRAVHVRPGSRTYSVTVPAAPGGTLTLRAGGQASVTDIELYAATQQGGTYMVTGKPEATVPALHRLNDELTGG